MARNVFISFRFSDGEDYKKEISELFDESEDVIDCSEDEDRSQMSESTIKDYLYKKLKNTSVTVVVLTPNAIEYEKDIYGQYDDWLYDELRYSLEAREQNATNGAIAVYTKEAKDRLIKASKHICDVCNKESTVSVVLDVDNLCRKNMCNVKNSYKQHKCKNVYDQLEDSYISLVPYEDFIADPDKYIENAVSKRERKDQFNLVKQL